MTQESANSFYFLNKLPQPHRLFTIDCDGHCSGFMGWNVEEVVRYCPGLLEGTEENFITSNILILSATSVLITTVI